jgi:hypothetical protein
VVGLTWAVAFVFVFAYWFVLLVSAVVQAPRKAAEQMTARINLPIFQTPSLVR